YLENFILGMESEELAKVKESDPNVSDGVIRPKIKRQRSKRPAFNKSSPATSKANSTSATLPLNVASAS
ncbi:hypothetical protein HK102_008819, partial [Quaeritorhiza haematococci]